MAEAVAAYGSGDAQKCKFINKVNSIKLKIARKFD